MSGRWPRATPHTVVVGAGVIGLSVALELARRGVSVALIGESRVGEASVAAAGMLAPSVEHLASPARQFGVESRDRYPAFLDRLAESSGISVPLDRRGILEVASRPEDAAAMRPHAGSDGAEWLDSVRLAQLEPRLAPAAGALFHSRDGAVDNVVLVRALERAVGRAAHLRRIHAAVRRVDPGADGVRVTCGAGDTLHSEQLVLAGGAWVTELDGLPRTLPVQPLRGQMLALGASPLRHVIYGAEGYLVPRGDRTLVGATMEEAGFDPSTTESAAFTLRGAAARLCPPLRQAPTLEQWAGLRPATPDLLPIVGPEPAAPRLVYACGHSRNGILMAPLTAECVAALITRTPLPCSLAPFDVTRFDAIATRGAAPA